MSVFQPDILRGKVAFIAGGTSGINLEIARTLAEYGAKVAVLSRSEDKVKAAVAELERLGPGAAGFSGDVRDFAAVDGAVKGAVAALRRRLRTVAPAVALTHRKMSAARWSASWFQSRPPARL